jgi:hypothetical protein
MKIRLSNNTEYEGVLIVSRSHEEKGWRLYWANPESNLSHRVAETGMCDPSGVHRTMRDAIALGEKRYGVKAIKDPWGD